MPHTSIYNEGPLTELLDLLSHPDRRRILATLRRHNPRDDDEFDPEEIAERSEDFEQFRAELFEEFLPNLNEAGFIEWDQQTDTVRRGPRFDEIEPLLELLAKHEDELPDDWP